MLQSLSRTFDIVYLHLFIYYSLYLTTPLVIQTITALENNALRSGRELFEVIPIFAWTDRL